MDVFHTNLYICEKSSIFDPNMSACVCTPGLPPFYTGYLGVRLVGEGGGGDEDAFPAL